MIKDGWNSGQPYLCQKYYGNIDTLLMGAFLQPRGSQIMGRCKQFGGAANNLGGHNFFKLNRICIGNMGTPSNILILSVQTVYSKI